MAAEKTELEWPYRPADFFEARYCWQTDDYKLVPDAGIVLVTLSRPSGPIDAGLQGRITKKVKALFLVRQLLIHRTFELGPMRVYQHKPNGKKSISIGVGGVIAFAAVGQGDVVVCDASGAVVRDTKSERIAEHDMARPLIFSSQGRCRQSWSVTSCAWLLYSSKTFAYDVTNCRSRTLRFASSFNDIERLSRLAEPKEAQHHRQGGICSGIAPADTRKNTRRLRAKVSKVPFPRHGQCARQCQAPA
jgi:hypothetical protein